MFTKIQYIIQEYKQGQLEFDQVALAIFKFQYENNTLYKSFCELMGIQSPEDIKSIQHIPFLPIVFFKHHTIKTGVWDAEDVFKSSGTTHANQSSHLIRDLEGYHHHALESFEAHFSTIDASLVLGLLPNYLEKGESSLVSMVNHFIGKSNHPDSGFFLHDHDALFAIVEKNKNVPIYLFGVSYALLDYVERYQHKDLGQLYVIETGGMKGRRKEMTKNEMYALLKQGFGLDRLYSEYGMTELLSQAYTLEEQLFVPATTMGFSIRELNDFRTEVVPGKTGQLHIIDLMNYASCSFIATDDLARSTDMKRFQIMGRRDHADLRGCNLLIEF